MLEVGKIKIDSAILAPMAGFTDSAFRLLCRKHGAGLVVTEMVSAKALCFKDKKTAELLRYCEDERPLAIQLFGSEPDCMAEAAKLLMPYKPDIIDVNMGCPVPKIAGNGCGSSLLKNHKLAGQIVSALVKAVDVPISVKMRIGWDKESICAAEFARVLEDNGAAFITVHGRTRDQYYQPPTNLDAIAAVSRAVNIPVVANGDVASAQDARKMKAHTGCDLVMIGRAALGNPFIFNELKCAENGESYTPPTFYKRMDVVKELCRLECENKGERLAMLELRRHLPFFFKGIRGAADIRRRCCAVSTKDELDEIIIDVTALYEESKEG
ncbi:MAG: tRNA dihydrouridine synthase DusB [Oscillospiraceae bacterium]|nr:tRNA dihydrouridine synthase DusB [Oscillospiraceae bacterium]